MCFSAINELSKFQIHFSQDLHNPDIRINSGFKPKIVGYSLQTWQKVAAITLCVLASIAFLIGVASHGGAHIVGTHAASALIGCGLSVGGAVIGFMAINHLLFLKKINKFLETQNLKIWTDGSTYREDEGQQIPYLLVDSENGIFARRIEKIENSSLAYYIEFHKH